MAHAAIKAIFITINRIKRQALYLKAKISLKVNLMLYVPKNRFN